MSISRIAAAVAVIATVTVCTASCGSDNRQEPNTAAPVQDMSDPATTHVENRDIYQTVRLEGAVETYDPVTVPAPAAGSFAPAERLANGQNVPADAVLGVVTTCPPALPQTGSPTTPADPAATPTTTPATPATPRCTTTRTTVRAPVAGTVSGLQEQTVEAGAAVASIQPAGFHARLPVTDTSVLYRFTTPPTTGKAEVVGGPSGFPVTYERQVYDKDSDEVSVYVTMPGDVQLFAGLHVVVVFVTSVKDDVPALPVSAVRGRSGHGEVVTVDAAGTKRRADVTIGESDDVYVEVHGIDAAAAVLLYPLESDFDG